jgi:hypothetical protein
VDWQSVVSTETYSAVSGVFGGGVHPDPPRDA